MKNDSAPCFGSSSSRVALVPAGRNLASCKVTLLERFVPANFCERLHATNTTNLRHSVVLVLNLLLIQTRNRAFAASFSSSRGAETR